MTIYKRHPKSVFSNPFFSTAFEAERNPRSQSTATPWDLIKTSEQTWRIDAVFAGYDLDDIDITQDGQTLSISAAAQDQGTDSDYIRQGLDRSAIDLSFRLGEHVEVETASLDKGLLSISLKRNLPEELQPRKITVEAGNQAA